MTSHCPSMTKHGSLRWKQREPTLNLQTLQTRPWAVRGEKWRRGQRVPGHLGSLGREWGLGAENRGPGCLGSLPSSGRICSGPPPPHLPVLPSQPTPPHCPAHPSYFPRPFKPDTQLREFLGVSSTQDPHGSHPWMPQLALSQSQLHPGWSDRLSRSTTEPVTTQSRKPAPPQSQLCVVTYSLVPLQSQPQLLRLLHPAQCNP